MRYFLLHLMVLVSLVMSKRLIAQEYSYVNYTTKEGLAGSTVYDAVQDKDGFMWFATENGLTRFDGRTFRNYTVADGLPDNEILKLFIDSKNRVWIMPFKNEICYYFKGKIYTKKNDFQLKSASLPNMAHQMLENSFGDLIVHSSHGSHFTIFLNSGGVISSDTLLDSKNIHGIIPGIDKYGRFRLLVQNYGRSRVDEGSHIFYWPLERKSEVITLPDTTLTILSYICTNSGEDFFYVSMPVYQKRLSQAYLKSFYDKKLFVKLPENTISVNHLGKDLFSFNSSNGCFIYNHQNNTKSSVLFPGKQINKTFIDSEGNYWFCSRGDGVLMIPAFEYKVQTKKTKASITGFVLNDSKVYIGTSGGVCFVKDFSDLKNGFETFKTKGSYFYDLKRKKLISDGRIEHLTKVLITNESGVFVGYSQKRFFLECPKSITYLPSGLLVSSCFGSYIYNLSIGVIDTIWNNRSTCSLEKDSGYYIGTLDGLYFVSRNRIITELGKQFPVLQSRIVNLTVSKDDILWVTTKGRGVCGYKNGKIIYEFNESNGLSNNDCSCIYADSNSNTLWVGTARGLNHIVYGQGRYSIMKYSSSDGLISDNITAVISAGNKVFVGTPGGICFFEPEKIRQLSSCNLVVTGVYVNENYYAYDTSDFRLAHENNNIRFEYCGISLKSGGEMIYEYKVEGLHNVWRKTNNNSLSFTTLPSGRYTLQLRAINKYGVVSKTKEITFEINQLIWEKLWFRLVAVLMFGGLIWMIWHYRIKSIREKNEEKTRISNRIAELEQTALRAQMNPHFIFNCLNSIQQYVAERDIKGANRFITDFSKVIRMTLDMSSKSQVSLREELEYLSAYLEVEKARMEERFGFSIGVAEDVNADDIYLPPLLLQPYAENSIRHGIKYLTEKGFISVFIKKAKEDAILIVIEDNGIGRKNAEQFRSRYHVEYQSKGMVITSDRIELNNQIRNQQIRVDIEDLSDNKGSATGTRVNIYLTLQE